MPNSRDQFNDYITPANCPSNNCGWVDLRHEFHYPDNKQQTEPAANAHFIANLPNGQRVEGNLDHNGEASFRSTGQGLVSVKYEPNIDTEINELQKEIKQALDEIIKAEKEETAKIQEEYNNSNWFGKRWEDTKSVGRGIGSLFSALWDVLVGIGDAIVAVTSKVGEYVLDPLNAPETFKEDVAAIKEKYEALKDFVDDDLETYFILMQDRSTWDMLGNFAEDYLDAQHYSEYIEGGSTAAAGIILTIATAGGGAVVAGGGAVVAGGGAVVAGGGAVVAGGGAVVAAGNAGTRMAAIASKISPKLKKVAVLIKRRRAKKTNKGSSNKRLASTLLLRISCFAPGKTARSSYTKRYPPKGINPQGRDIDQEFDWQLKGQQDGINNMSPDELLEGMDAYKNIKRNPTKAAKTRKKYRKKVFVDKLDELKENTNLSKIGRDKQANKYADSVINNMHALHNPDLIAGGDDITTAMGDKGVNSSIGVQWKADKRKGNLKKRALEAKARGDKKMNIKLIRCK